MVGSTGREHKEAVVVFHIALGCIEVDGDSPSRRQWSSTVTVTAPPCDISSLGPSLPRFHIVTGPCLG